MNLRSVTIWMTGLLSLGMLCIPPATIPFAISWLVARRLKYEIPSIILLCPTIVCGLLFAPALIAMFFHPDHHRCGCGDLYALILSLMFMPPVWIFVLIMNSYYVKKTKHKKEPGM